MHTGTFRNVRVLGLLNSPKIAASTFACARTEARASVPRHAAACHSSALRISPTISHQPTSAKVRPEMRAIAISAIRK